MADYNPIPQQTVTPDPMQKLSSLLGVAQGAQNYNLGKDTYDARVLNANSTASSAQSKATVDQANVQPLIGEQSAKTSSAQTKASSDKFGLQKDYANTAQQVASGLLADPAISGPNYDPQKATQAILNAKNRMKNMGVPEDQAELAAAPLYMQVHTPGAIAQTLKNTVLGGMNPAQQGIAITPGGIGINNGAGSATVNTNPFAGQVGSPVPGTPVVQQVGPAQPTMGGPNGATPGVMGPQAGAAPFAPHGSGFPGGVPPELGAPTQGAARSPQFYAGERNDTPPPRPPGAAAPPQAKNFIPTALPPGQAGNMENNTALMNDHYAKLAGNASDAQTALGLTGNIKSLAAGAATGTEAGRKAYVAGLLNTLHLGNQATGDLQHDTDLLEKNMAQLNMATPAGTDAARTLVTAGRPHGTMSAPAIQDAANQVASQIQANVAVRNYLTPYKFGNGGKGDPEGYQAARQQIESTADPRAWQYANLQPGSPEAKQFMSKLDPQDRAQLVQKIGHLEQMGMIK